MDAIPTSWQRFARWSLQLGATARSRLYRMKTRIAFQVRMSFAAFTLKKHLLNGHVVLARRRDSPRFTKVWGPSPRNQVHEFRLRGPDDVDEEVADWLREAYAVGQQKHLASRGEKTK